MNTLLRSIRKPAAHPLSRLLPRKPQGPMQVPARLLGWFSIALGATELLAPRAVARATGATPTPDGVVRAYGLREIGVGVALLNARDPAPWLWLRVAGDVLDAATVAAAATDRGGRRPTTRALVSLAALGGVLALDAACAVGASRGPRKAVRDYSGRSGFPRPVEEMRGAARSA